MRCSDSTFSGKKKKSILKKLLKTQKTVPGLWLIVVMLTIYQLSGLHHSPPRSEQGYSDGSGEESTGCNAGRS